MVEEAVTHDYEEFFRGDLPGLAEESHTYIDDYNGVQTELHGHFIYPKEGNGALPGMVLFGGPWGSGGGKAERAYARQYAMKGMVVFLPDYFGGEHSEDDGTIWQALALYNPGLAGLDQVGFLQDHAWSQRIAGLALSQLLGHAQVDPTRVAAIGFCFGGAMTLQLGRFGGNVQVAASFHGEYPENNGLRLGTEWNVGYFTEMIGVNDPLIPPADQTKWVDELKDLTATNDDSDYEVELWGKTVHAFAIQYSDVFLSILSNPPFQAGIAVYDQARAKHSFAKLDSLLKEHGLIADNSHPTVVPCPRMGVISPDPATYDNGQGVTPFNPTGASYGEKGHCH